MFKNFISTLSLKVKTYFKDKSISFYIGFSIAVLSVFVSFFYLIAYAQANDFNAWIFVLTLLGGLSYFAISLFGMNNEAATALSVLDFFGVILFIRAHYTVILENDFMSGEFTVTPNMVKFILITVFLLVITVTSNVLCWKKNKHEVKEEIENDAQA